MTKDRLRQRARRVAFVGSKSLGFACLESMYEFDASIVSLVVTVDDRDDTRSNFEQIAGLCESHETPIVVANSRADSEDAICSVAPDLCVVSGWYWILGERALKAISGPCIGTHHSLLPQYRGGAPLVWAVINGETQVGTSLFELSAGMDEGPIYSALSIPIEPDEYIEKIRAKVDNASIEMFRDAYPGIAEGRLHPEPQILESVTYCPMRRPEDGLIDWSLPADRLHNFIRAQSHPYPGAFTYFDDKKLTIWRAKSVDTKIEGTTGQVGAIQSDGVVICSTGRGSILVQEVQLAGGHSRPATEVLNSITIRLNNTLTTATEIVPQPLGPST